MKISPAPCENALFVVFAADPCFCTRKNKGQKQRERAVSFLFATMGINQKRQGQAQCIVHCLSCLFHHCPLHDVDNNPPHFQDDPSEIHQDTGFDKRTTSGTNDDDHENTATKHGVRNSHHHPATPPTSIATPQWPIIIKPAWEHICDTMKDCVVQKAWWKWDLCVSKWLIQRGRRGRNGPYQRRQSQRSRAQRPYPEFNWMQQQSTRPIWYLLLLLKWSVCSCAMIGSWKVDQEVLLAPANKLERNDCGSVSIDLHKLVSLLGVK